jgi:cytochrome P450
VTESNDLERICKHFDPTDEVHMQDPYPAYEVMRQQCPVGKSDSYGRANWAISEGPVWMLTRYEDVTAAALDTGTFSSHQSQLARPRRDSSLNSFLSLDPPEHRFYRRVLTRPLGPAEVNRLEESIRGIARDLIRRFASAGECDLVSDYCYPLVSLALWQPSLLGNPMGFESGGDRIAWLSEWIGDLRHPERIMEATAAMTHYLNEVLDDRARNPQDDIPSALLEADIDGEPMSRTSQLNYLWFLTKAGIETPAAALTAALHFLAKHAEVQEKLRADPATIPAAMEELLRLVGPVHTAERSLNNDTELHGQQLRTGEPLMLMWQAANRDPEQFPNPDEFQVDRPRNKHLAFGAGIHKCIGLHLARLVMRIAAEELLESLPNFRVKDGASLWWHTAEVQSGLSDLPVVFEPHAADEPADQIAAKTSSE